MSYTLRNPPALLRSTVWKDGSPASTIPPVLQRWWKSVYWVQLSKSGKYASGKIVALNTLILSNVEAPSARLLTCNIFLATLQYSDVFWATFLPEAYLPDFDSCTKYTDFQQRWSTGGIVEAGASVLPDCTCMQVFPCLNDFCLTFYE